MGNLGGGEILVILLVALVVLGPTKLPEAARQVGRAANELRRMSGAFQRELRQAIHDPINETKAVIKDPGSTGAGSSSSSPSASEAAATPEPAASEPATTKPATSKPATSKTATSKPATSKPATSKPATSKPATSKPATSKPATTKPATTKSPESSDGPHPSAKTESSGDPEASEG